jgi:hypothetical protein
MRIVTGFDLRIAALPMKAPAPPAPSTPFHTMLRPASPPPRQPVPAPPAARTTMPAALATSAATAPPAKGLSDAFRMRLGAIARRWHARPADLLAVMLHESGLNPAARCKTSSAIGLFQFMPDCAADLLGMPKPTKPTHPAVMRTAQDFADYQKALGEYHTALKERGREAVERVAAMTQEQQLDLVEKYLEAAAPGRSLSSLSDVYMAVFWPSAIGKGPEHVIASKDSPSPWLRQVYEENKGLDVDGDGKITVGDATASVAGVASSRPMLDLTSQGLV